MRTIGELPPELAPILFALGPRTLVLLEGGTDCEVFREWYREHLGAVEFYLSTGYPNVQSFLDAILGEFPKMKAYGIIDRDFRDDAEVEAALRDEQARLFILRRYSLENYLLEPEAVFEDLRVSLGSAFSVSDVREIERKLLELCHVLCTVAAANWVFYEVGGIDYFRAGDNRRTQAELLPEISRRLQCDEDAAQMRIEQKEALLLPYLSDLDTAHTRINGKHLLHLAHEEYLVQAKGGVQREPWCRLLAHFVKVGPGLHADIRAIMEDRILAN